LDFNNHSFIDNVRWQEVFEKTFTDWYEGLYGYAFSMLKDQDTAAEVVQNVFCKIWEKRDGLYVHTSARAYLYGAVYHECINWMRQEKKSKDYRKQVLQGGQWTEGTPASGKVEMDELEKKIQQAMDMLPEQCRAIFLLSRFGNLKYREIAEQLGIAVKTVEAQVSKALKFLRQELTGFIE